MSFSLSSTQEPRIMYEGLFSTKEKKEAIKAELHRLNKAEEVEKDLVILLEERDAAAAVFAKKITSLQETLFSLLCDPLVLSAPPAPPCSPLPTSIPATGALSPELKMKKNGQMETLAEAAARQKKNIQNQLWRAKNPEAVKASAKKTYEKKKASRLSPSSLAASPSSVTD